MTGAFFHIQCWWQTHLGPFWLANGTFGLAADLASVPKIMSWACYCARPPNDTTHLTLGTYKMDLFLTWVRNRSCQHLSTPESTPEKSKVAWGKLKREATFGPNSYCYLWLSKYMLHSNLIGHHHNLPWYIRAKNIFALFLKHFLADFFCIITCLTIVTFCRKIYTQVK